MFLRDFGLSFSVSHNVFLWFRDHRLSSEVFPVLLFSGKDCKAESGLQPGGKERPQYLPLSVAGPARGPLCSLVVSASVSSP